MWRRRGRALPVVAAIAVMATLAMAYTLRSGFIIDWVFAVLFVLPFAACWGAVLLSLIRLDAVAGAALFCAVPSLILVGALGAQIFLMLAGVACVAGGAVTLAFWQEERLVNSTTQAAQVDANRHDA